MQRPVPLRPWPVDDEGPRCARGTRRPRAIAWFGFSAFWGHLRHLVASAIATDNIDSRQWMIPEAPDRMLASVMEVLRPGRRDRTDRAAGGATLVDAMDGDVWIDFVSDTGDDVTVSKAVAEMFSCDYAIEGPDGSSLTLPRGDILFLGGDLAYPVATVREITRRLVEPWNSVLERRLDGMPRVLLAVPGNHDWYDGLDGFARLCSAPCAFEDAAPVSADPLHPKPNEHPVLAWAEAFARGDQVRKPTQLALAGYAPVQRASYFRLPLAPGIDLFAVDRQLKRVDVRQTAYFAVRGAPARFVVMPDPARAWGETRPHGKATLESLGIRMDVSPTLLLAGDIHHYERSHEGPSTHVVAGGGGAFLHGARIADGAAYPVEAEFPGKKASWKMLRDLPLHCATGKAGLLLLAVFAVCDALALREHFARGALAGVTVALVVSLVVAFNTALLVGWRRHRTAKVVPFALAIGLGVGAVPVGFGVLADAIAMRVIGAMPFAREIAFMGALGVATHASAFFFGTMLALVARLGLNHTQPYAALGAAGFKHFLRLRVRGPSEGRGAAIDAWVIGVVDPIRDPTPVLVDTFSFEPEKAR